MTDDLPLLSKLPLFENIKSEEISPLLACLGAQKRKLRKGDFFILEGSPVSAMGIILSGAVQILQEDVWGNRALLAECRKGDIFGETLVCTGVPQSPVSVVATEPTRVLQIPFKPIITPCGKACTYHQGLVENMLKIISRKTLHLNQKIKILSCRTTRDKLLCFFGTQIQQKGRCFTLPFNREELADFICVNRSALSRELSNMKAEGLIDYQGNSFKWLK